MISLVNSHPLQDISTILLRHKHKILTFVRPIHKRMCNNLWWYSSIVQITIFAFHTEHWSENVTTFLLFHNDLITQNHFPSKCFARKEQFFIPIGDLNFWFQKETKRFNWSPKKAEGHHKFLRHQIFSVIKTYQNFYPRNWIRPYELGEWDSFCNRCDLCFL